MKCLTSLIPALLLAFASSSVLARKRDDAVLLSNVKSLTLRDGHRTSYRRVDPLPQLSCVGGDGCRFYKVDVMRCTNSGSEYDSEDISWTCKANLPPEFKLGSTDVICEGYDNANDPYVLKGSCGVEYRLMLTELGDQIYRDHIDHKAWARPSGSDSKEKEGSDKLASALFWLIFMVIVLVILYSIFNPERNNARDSGDGSRRGYRPGGGGGGGGGNDDDDDDPPPPYTPRADPRSKKPSNSWYSSRSPNTRSSSSRQQSQGWRPGFWTGTATGAAAGYAAGAYANRDHQRNGNAQPGRSSWFGTTNTSPPGGRAAGPNQGGSSYYGGGSSGGGSRWGGGGGASSSSSPPEPSNSRSEATGFGGTRRR